MEKPAEITPNNENGAVLLPQNEKKKLTCNSITCWVLQIIIWAGGIFLLFAEPYWESEYSGSKYMTAEYLIVLIFECMFYLSYVIFQFFSPTLDYLTHKRTDVNLYQKMKQLFNNPPKLQFVCECYHYETRTYTTYDSKGHATTNTTQVRVVTHVDSKFFNYYSSRDVSGLFQLNYDESSITNKYYVKLELLAEFNFADAITYSDYKKEKDEFYNSNLHYDVYMDFYERTLIDGLTSYNLINLSDSNPCSISVFWYVVFIFLGIVQLYKSYINSKCIYKSFTIRKLISSRYSLTTEECNFKYRRVDPVISYEEKNIKLDANDFGYICSDFQLQLPTEEEIEFAEQYKDKVFNPGDENCDGQNVEFKNVINKDTSSDTSSETDDNLKTNLIQ